MACEKGLRQQRLEFVKLDLPGFVGVDLVDEAVDVYGQPEVVLDDFHQGFPAALPCTGRMGRCEGRRRSAPNVSVWRELIVQYLSYSSLESCLKSTEFMRMLFVLCGLEYYARRAAFVRTLITITPPSKTGHARRQKTPYSMLVCSKA